MNGGATHQFNGPFPRGEAANTSHPVLSLAAKLPARCAPYLFLRRKFQIRLVRTLFLPASVAPSPPPFFRFALKLDFHFARKSGLSARLLHGPSAHFPCRQGSKTLAP